MLNATCVDMLNVCAFAISVALVSIVFFFGVMGCSTCIDEELSMIGVDALIVTNGEAMFIVMMFEESLFGECKIIVVRRGEVVMLELDVEGPCDPSGCQSVLGKMTVMVERVPGITLVESNIVLMNDEESLF